MEKKQSSVDWLKKAFYTYAESTLAIDTNKWVMEEEALEKLFQEAKAMQEEQYIDAHYDGQIKGFLGVPSKDVAKPYYKETFGE